MAEFSKTFIIYDTRTGEIKRTGNCPTDMVVLQPDGSNFEAVMEGEADDSIHYILNGVLAMRPENPSTIDKITMAANGVEITTISNIPNPSTVTIFPIAMYTVTDGTLQFTIDTPGEYKITIQGAPYLNKEFTVNAS
jgi:hypothetical protein